MSHHRDHSVARVVPRDATGPSSIAQSCGRDVLTIGFVTFVSTIPMFSLQNWVRDPIIEQEAERFQTQCLSNYSIVWKYRHGATWYSELLCYHTFMSDPYI